MGVERRIGQRASARPGVESREPEAEVSRTLPHFAARRPMWRAWEVWTIAAIVAVSAINGARLFTAALA